MQLTITRKFCLFACMCRTRITVITETGEEVAKLFLLSGQVKTLSLPGQRYILKASTFIPLARLIENTALCYGDRFEEVHRDFLPYRTAVSIYSHLSNTGGF